MPPEVEHDEAMERTPELKREEIGLGFADTFAFHQPSGAVQQESISGAK